MLELIYTSRLGQVHRQALESEEFQLELLEMVCGVLRINMSENPATCHVTQRVALGFAPAVELRFTWPLPTTNRDEDWYRGLFRDAAKRMVDAMGLAFAPKTPVTVAVTCQGQSVRETMVFGPTDESDTGVDAEDSEPPPFGFDTVA